MDKDFQPDLFPELELNIPAWLPNETLYSLVSRHHRLCGDPHPSSTSTRLFGGARRGTQHDFPSGLNYFVDVTKQSYGNCHSIIAKRTILPYFLPFKDKQNAEDAFAAMASPNIGSLKYRLGILTSRFGADHPLKACPKCVVRDRNTYSVAYWHRDHQIPGVWLCSKHNLPLLVSTLKSSGIARFSWLLPDQSKLSPINKPFPIEHLKSLSEISIGITNLPPGTYFNPLHVLQAYIHKLKSRDLLTPGGSLRLSKIASEYYQFSKRWEYQPISGALPTSEKNAAAQIGRLFRTPRTGTHPLRHTMVITWLFSSWQKFLQSYKAAEASTPNPPHKPESKQIIEERADVKKNHFINLIKQQGYSVTNAAVEVGIAPSTGMGWASEIGISVKRRSKILNTEICRQMTGMIEAGHDKKAIASHCGISIQTISRYMRSEVGLLQKWTEKRVEIRRDKERHNWQTLADHYSVNGIKVMRMLGSSTYAWLYKNDRSWLETFNQSIPKIKRGNSSCVNWDKRDELLCCQVRATALSIAESNISNPITLTCLLQSLPELRTKIQRIDRLPLTNKALGEILNKPKKNIYDQRFSSS